MNIFRKFEFTPPDWEAKKKLIQKEVATPEGTTCVWSDDVALVYEIGHICAEWGKDKEGMTTCVKQSEKVAVDIVWKDEVHPDFIAHLIWPKNPMHSLGETLDTEYQNNLLNLQQ
jgi:hypothetical protein